ncbi:MAG: imidazoleglycerol-phosphate dehydratase HisB [Candidatus Omnitrophica bacterium]|jgi:imidazoleglycerol-phosphate dehydratase|nr:imidazoleglycerol-phosphate dehydratase HisB [Candidatus Omnitrophota bacterium]
MKKSRNTRKPAAVKAALPQRTASIRRVTRETTIEADLNLDGSGASKISTGLPFLDHMLDLFTKHGIFNLKLIAKGDLEIDIHHTNEDIGIVIGQAFKQALNDKKGIRRFGSCFVPMDETLSRVRVALDISGRPSLYFTAPKNVAQHFVHRDYTIHDARELIKAFAIQSGINMHVDVLKGDDPHHILESIFKAFGRAMEQATRVDARIPGVPSTKGLIEK